MSDKEHPASEQQRQRFRDRGEVATSQDLTRLALLMGGVGALFAFGATSTASVVGITKLYLGDLSRPMNSAIGMATAKSLAVAIAPTLLGALVLGVAAGAAQSGGRITWEALGLKLDRLNPITKLQQMLLSKDTVIGVLSSIIKVTTVALVCAGTLWQRAPELVTTQNATLASVLVMGADLIVTLLLRVGGTMLVIAAADYGVQWWRMEEKMKMSTQELRDDMKEMMGDPMIRSRRKRKHRELVEQRSIKAVPTADVVIVNPTHYAVALKYDREGSGAPKVVAKGADTLAAKIRELARQNGIPIVSQPPLARALYAAVKVGKEVPAELYQAVAVVIAYVFEIRRRRS